MHLGQIQFPQNLVELRNLLRQKVGVGLICIIPTTAGSVVNCTVVFKKGTLNDGIIGHIPSKWKVTSGYWTESVEVLNLYLSGAPIRLPSTASPVSPR